MIHPRYLKLKYYPAVAGIEVIKGASAEDIANTIIKRGLLSRLDHAAYLGRELAKAETALNLSIPYKQDETLYKEK